MSGPAPRSPHAAGPALPVEDASEADTGTDGADGAAAVKRWVRKLLWAGVVLLLMAELIDDLKISQRRLAHVASSWWARLERRERRHARRSEIAVLASRLGKPRSRRQP
jgi:hypothetical protein